MTGNKYETALKSNQGVLSVYQLQMCQMRISILLSNVDPEVTGLSAVMSSFVQTMAVDFGSCHKSELYVQ